MAVNGNALLPTTPVGESAKLHPTSSSESCPLIVEAEDEYEDTDGSRTILSSSDVASISSYPSTLSSSDTLSLASTCSTVIDHPPSSSRNVSSMPAGHTTVRNNRQKQTSVATVAGITVTATVVDIHGSRLVVKSHIRNCSGRISGNIDLIRFKWKSLYLSFLQHQ